MLLFLLGLTSLPATAVVLDLGEQVPVEARIELLTTLRDTDRGISRGANIEPQAAGGFGITFGGVTASAGAWSALEPHSTANEPRPDLRVGDAGLSQWSAWAQLETYLRPFALNVGVIRDGYRRMGDHLGRTELYGGIAFEHQRWSIGTRAFHAIDGASGTYFEPFASFRHFVSPFMGSGVTLISTAEAGLQSGLRNSDPRIPGASGTGLTHAYAGTALRIDQPLFNRIGLVLHGGPRLEFRRDTAARLTRSGHLGKPIAIGLPVTVGLMYPMPRRQ